MTSAHLAFPGNEWQSSSPRDQGVDPGKLEQALSRLDTDLRGHGGIRRMVVVRNGYLLWRGRDTGRVHDVWSCTKSFTATTLGLLIDDKRCTPATRAMRAAGLPEGDYADVSLRHFASMTSGYDAGGAQSDTPFSPTAPLFVPGMRFAYWDSAMNQCAHVLTRIADEQLLGLFRRRVADPIGIPHGRLQWGDWGVVDGLTINGGAGNKSRGISICAEDFARLGLLYLARGRWEDRQLLSAGFIDQATTAQVPAALPTYEPGASGPGVYGLSWWVNGVGPDGLRRWPHAPSGTFCAAGFNNNRCFVVPEWRMVIVRLGMGGEPGDLVRIWDRFFSALGAAV
ncbi:MAG: serine hydrolase [Chitinivibrionales bacterium]|nr:serine hydrolase [Chitinivibrionales bacterium]